MIDHFISLKLLEHTLLSQRDLCIASRIRGGQCKLKAAPIIPLKKTTDIANLCGALSCRETALNCLHLS